MNPNLRVQAVFPRDDQAHRLSDEILLIPPPTIPVAIRPEEGCYASEAGLAAVDLTLPGLEVDFMHPNGNVYFIVVHAIADFDYGGQMAFFQIALRGENSPHQFGAYRYCFAYRGGTDGVSWDHWTVDLNFGTERPTHTQFGSYCDDTNTCQPTSTIERQREEPTATTTRHGKQQTLDSIRDSTNDSRAS